MHGDGEVLPLRDASVDIVLSDHGAMSWGDPYRTLPEVARVLRPGGRVAFNAGTPWVCVCQQDADAAPSQQLLNPYFGLHRVDEGGGAATFILGYGDWVRLFRRCGLLIENYVELRPPDAAPSVYDFMPAEWARSWPAEAVWVGIKKMC